MLHIVVSVYFVTVTASLATHPFLPSETIFVGDLQFRDSASPRGWLVLEPIEQTTGGRSETQNKNPSGQ